MSGSASLSSVPPQLFLGDLIVIIHDTCQVHGKLLECNYSNERICQISQGQLSLPTSGMLRGTMFTVRQSRALAEILCGLKKKNVGLNIGLYLMGIIKRI